jgi:hypothetical protein
LEMALAQGKEPGVHKTKSRSIAPIFRPVRANRLSRPSVRANGWRGYAAPEFMDATNRTDNGTVSHWVWDLHITLTVRSGSRVVKCRLASAKANGEITA